MLPLLVLSSCSFPYPSSSASSSSEENASSNPSSVESSLIESSSSGDSQSSSSDLSPYTLVWEDNFNAATLNESDWSYMYGDGTNYGNPGWGNGEAQFYTKTNTRLANGQLIITAKAESLGGRVIPPAVYGRPEKYPRLMDASKLLFLCPRSLGYGLLFGCSLKAPPLMEVGQPGVKSTLWKPKGGSTRPPAARSTLAKSVNPPIFLKPKPFPVKPSKVFMSTRLNGKKPKFAGMSMIAFL